MAPTQARRKRPRPRSTGIHAQADRQTRNVASPIARARSGAPISTGTLTMALPSGWPSSSAEMAIVPQTRATTETLM